MKQNPFYLEIILFSLIVFTLNWDLIKKKKKQSCKTGIRCCFPKLNKMKDNEALDNQDQSFILRWNFMSGRVEGMEWIILLLSYY